MSARIYPLGPTEAAMYPDKEFATQQARAALLGAILHRVEDDRGDELFIVSKWNLTRHLRTLDDVAAWIDRLEGKA